MTRLMEQAIERLRAIPDAQQDRLAEFVLYELAEDERWARTTRDHAKGLEALVREVIADDANGCCRPPDPDRL